MILKAVEFFINRPKVVNLILIFICFAGFLSLMHVQKQGYPSVDMGIVQITTVYPGASPKDVELKVTTKLEDELKNVDGIKELTSASIENFSNISIMIEDGYDYDKVKNDIKKAIDKVDALPNEVSVKPYITEIKTDEMPILELAIVGDADYSLKRKYALALEKKIQANRLVGKIQKVGYLKKEVKIEVNQADLSTKYVSLGEIMLAIKSHNYRMSAGNLKSQPAEKKFVVMSEFNELTDVGEVIVRSGFDGNSIKVSDVAIINDAYEDPQKIPRVNGKKSINLLVIKKAKSDQIDTTKQIQNIVKEFKKTLPNNIEVIEVFDFSIETRGLLDLVTSNAKIGFLLVVITLVLMLNIRVAFWTALGIPISLFFAFIFFPVFGLSLNFITLTAIIIVLGMLVDDAIIIAENIYGYREQGLPPKEAAIKGVKEVIWPVLTTILTTMIVFVPMLSMTGIMGKFMKAMPIVVILTLLGSLLEGLFILPSHIAHTKINKNKKTLGIFNKIANHYEKLLKVTIKHKVKTVLVFLVILMLTFTVVGSKIKFILFDSSDGFYTYIEFEMPKGTALGETSKQAKQIEAIIDSMPKGEIASYVTTIGEKTPALANFSYGINNNSVGNVMMYLTPIKSRSRTAVQIVADLRERLKGITTFKRLVVDLVPDGPPMGKPVTVTLISDNDESRNALAAELKTFLNEQKGVSNIIDNQGTGKSRIVIRFNYELMSRLGLNAVSVADTIRAAFDGTVVSDLRWEGEEVDYRVILNSPSRATIRTLKNLTVLNNQGKLVPLGQFITMKEQDDLLMINHDDGDRSITIYADLDTKIITSTEMSKIIKYKFEPIVSTLPDMRISFGGEEKDTQEAMQSLGIAFIVALTGVYFILVILFNSFLQPLLVMSVIPFSFAGVIIAFFLNGLPLSELLVWSVLLLTIHWL